MRVGLVKPTANGVAPLRRNHGLARRSTTLLPCTAADWMPYPAFSRSSSVSPVPQGQVELERP